MGTEPDRRLNATKHYQSYPEGDFPPYLAYGFRPIFLVLAPYIVISIALWGFAFSGVIPMTFISHPMDWHIHELLFGVGTAGIMAFLFTGLPELFPGVVPVVGKRLQWIVGMWICARLGFWLINYISAPLVGLLNTALFGVIIFQARPVFFDPLRKHISIGYVIAILAAIQLWFFLSIIGITTTSTIEILKVGLGGFMLLVILVLRRVNMEGVNEILEDEGSDDAFFAKPYRYNIAIFAVSIFTLVEYLYPGNSALGWIGFAVASAALGILSDFALEDERIILKPFVFFLMSVLVLFALGYGSMGYAHLFLDGMGINHFRHFLTSGVFGLSFYLVMVIISFVHTGRPIKVNISITLGFFLIWAATLMRAMIPILPFYSRELYLFSSIVWALPFVLYMIEFFPYLLQPRADGIPG